MHNPVTPVSRLLLAGLVLAVSACAVPVPPTVDHDASQPATTLRGYRFHAETLGPSGAPVVIVLHGGPGADYRYLAPLRALADRYRVVFYDQRGTGLSPRVSADQITPEVFLQDLDAWVDHAGQGRPVILVGHSWGAMLASAYLGRFPHKVARAVLAEPGFLDARSAAVLMQARWPGWQALWVLGTAWLGQWGVDTQGDAYARKDWFYTRILPHMHPAANLCQGQLPPLLAWRAGSPNLEATIGRMQRDPDWARSLSFRTGVEHFSGAVQFLVGACSGLTGAAHQGPHMAHFSHAHLVQIPQAGHYLFNDQPEASVAAVRAFLDETAWAPR